MAQADARAARELLREDIRNVQFGVSDNVLSTRNALRIVFPKMSCLNCWSHLAVIGMKPGLGGVWKQLANKGLADFFKNCLDCMHVLTLKTAVGAYVSLSYFVQ
jgi:hypothetical protein